LERDRRLRRRTTRASWPRAWALDPYKLGVELYRNIEERWNKGQFGQEWEDCDDLDVKRIGSAARLGKQKVFEVRALYTNVTFIDEFLTPEFAMENKMFTFNWSNRNERYENRHPGIPGRKEKLLAQLTNFGPFHFRGRRQL